MKLYGIIRIEDLNNQVVEQYCSSKSFNRLNTLSDITEYLSNKGWELGDPTKGNPLTWPYTAYAYNSPNKQGYGRSGSSLWSIPVRRNNAL